MECCCPVINFWLSASKWYAYRCLLAISAGPVTPYVVKSFCFQRLDSRCQWNGTEGDWHISVGLSQPHYAAGWQFDSRCQLAGRLVLPSPHHIRNGFTTSVIHLPAADASIARCNYFYSSMRRLVSWLRFTIMTWMANRLTNATLCTSM